MRTASAELDALAQDFYDAICEQSPFYASAFGVPGFDHLVPDVSHESDARTRAKLTAIVEAAEALDPDALDTTSTVTRLMLISQATSAIHSIDAKTVEFGASAWDGPQASVLSSLPKQDVNGHQRLNDYLARLASVPSFLDGAIRRLADGRTGGRLPVAQLVQAGIDQIASYLATELENDPLLTPLRDSNPSDEVLASARAIVEGDVRPAFQRLHDAYLHDVLPASRDNDHPGVCHLPGGEDIYAAALRDHTTTDLSAEQIHQLGLKVVAGLDAEYASVGSTALGIDDPAKVRQILRDDLTLRFATRDEVFEVAVEATERATAALPEWFGLLPTHPCAVEVTPDIEAPNSTVGYYQPPAGDGSRPGAYYINTWQPETRTRYEAEALAFHEGVPGHHLQITISQALDGLPAFRKYGYVTAHAEGWALYTERLADEMGLYSSEVSRLGMLSFDSWRACRLVVDTGLHAFGWSRSRAISYLADNTALSMDNIRNEVDRYIAWPGQACAYMIGRLEIVRLRASAEAALGDAFNLPGFHDVVVGQGAVPLDVLAQMVDAWITAGHSND